MASIGAFISAKEHIIEFMRYNMRSQMFAKSLPMPLVVGARKRLELLRTQPEHKENLWKIASAVQKGLIENGFNIGDTNSAVTPVFLQGNLAEATDRKSTCLNSSHVRISYAVFC